ncbi:RNA demethylase ALKBH9B-like [Salvia splendens]|uniref:RNA demethylase ALKBH9B-like n=1 Tax=Salvia splendens TaxID=180675 RepID=UPI001C27FF09|nr:RNA demethylase ALKBH9B-like [Salvia splendens]
MNGHAKAQNTDEVRIASEFLSNWLPFLARGLCKSCTHTISHRIRSLHTERDAAVSTQSIVDANHCKEDLGDCTARSTGSAKDSADNYDDDDDTHSLGSWMDEADRMLEQAVEASSRSEPLNSSARQPRPMLKKSWADMAMEDEVVAGDDNDESNGLVDANDSFSEVNSVAEAKPKVALKGKRTFYVWKGSTVNILEGLELHKAIFSAAEQKRIVSFVGQLEEMGKKGQLKARTYTAPQKWMRGKGRITLQFGCCYNYATILLGDRIKRAIRQESSRPKLSIRCPNCSRSVLVLKGNGADVAKHCVPAVPSKRISITFRRMDDTKRPMGYTPEPDLQGLQPLMDEEERSSKDNASKRQTYFEKASRWRRTYGR